MIPISALANKSWEKWNTVVNGNPYTIFYNHIKLKYHSRAIYIVKFKLKEKNWGFEFPGKLLFGYVCQMKILFTWVD